MTDTHERFDHANAVLLHLAKSDKFDPSEQRDFQQVAEVLRIAEDRIGALEVVVKFLAKKAEINRSELGYPTGRPYPESKIGDLLR
jgi:hypothetical protein